MRLRSEHRRARLLARTALVTAFVVIVGPLAPVGAAAVEGWQRPVDGRVVRGFEAPAARFARGHRGADFAAAPGTPVRAANDGRITFAGDVAGTLHVVVLHDGGIRTTYAFLSSADVHVGDTVRRGQVVGATGGHGEGHQGNVLHLSARIGERYVDPLLLFEPTDLTELVRLVPTSEIAAAERATPEEEEFSLLEFLLEDEDGGGCGPFGLVCAVKDGIDFFTGLAGDAVQWAWDGVHEAIDFALDAIRAINAAAAELVERIGPLLHKLADLAVRIAKDAALRYLRSTPWGFALLAAYHYGKALYDYATQDCDENAKSANGHGGSGNWVMVAGGLGSHNRWRGRRDAEGHRVATPGFGFEAHRLNYDRDDVEGFSYDKSSAVYAEEDTYKSLERSARLYAEQLKAHAREHPGRPVDLVGHSQGGVVIRLFIARYWEGHESEYPEIANVIFYATPQKGTPAAHLAKAIDKSPGAPGLDLAHELGAPDLDSAAVQDLSDDSDVVRYLADHPVPKRLHVLSIGAALDPLVPPESIEGKNDDERIVTQSGGWSPFDDHSSIYRDDEALAAHRAFVEGRKLPCTSLSDALLAATGEAILGEGERALADNAGLFAITR